TRRARPPLGAAGRAAPPPGRRARGGERPARRRGGGGASAAAGGGAGGPAPASGPPARAAAAGATCPTRLAVTAEADGLIMALEHTDRPVHGVQFHPESILSQHGETMVRNFLDLAAAWNAKGRNAESRGDKRGRDVH
ncbi:glutamine amidotransferase-related protein, partial [Methylobacterium aquaticum]|uniref:glutamine amidotransferase-related protein n=1 Tax=Methylobacterium aquaticum TaxID=270351 RepID=UPI003CC9795D